MAGGNKSNFQPKDARAVSILYSDEDEDDISDLFPHEKPKRMMTGTQALVEFLKTTSPEEFQRTSSTPAEHKSMNNLFAKIRRGPKRNTNTQQRQSSAMPIPTTSSSVSTRSTASLPVHQNNLSTFSGSSASTITTSNHPHHWMHSSTGSEISSNGHTIHRKKYIEIVPQHNPTAARNPRSPSYDTTSIQSFVLRNNNNNTTNSIINSNNATNTNSTNQNGGEPILPNKKRESSLYSGSLRYSVSVRSQLSTATSSNNNIYTNGNNRRHLIRDSNSNDNSNHIGHHQQLESKATEDYLIAADGLDTIEAALLQRLERIRLVNGDIPSEQVAAGLAAEHIRALGITHDLEYQHHQHSEKRKVRHMQVQTEDSFSKMVDSKNTNQNNSNNDEPITTAASETNQDEHLNAEVRARRAEAALENALDNFEVISGLAYKKLRELWEEKMRWENACMELRDRLLMLEQQQQRRIHKQSHQQQEAGAVNVNDHLHNEYFLEENEDMEEEDGLGLSEFPCDEEEEVA
ncbi:hypothetical protein BDF20DRAFT_474276 [Mycotypha africana]|uniref:uncharacterized protein n=1 Tax=Mycotypha africana TaxID=64632 RepID=UPI002301991A|nr:uncharacterized protein BDF20DRAFT_474276 [Mycotypha africana]KAI8982461.1 hypothetical protein BDF20DRAFT_474276 [Mycotypha africana]